MTRPGRTVSFAAACAEAIGMVKAAIAAMSISLDRATARKRLDGAAAAIRRARARLLALPDSSAEEAILKRALLLFTPPPRGCDEDDRDYSMRVTLQNMLACNMRERMDVTSALVCAGCGDDGTRRIVSAKHWSL